MTKSPHLQTSLEERKTSYNRGCYHRKDHKINDDFLNFFIGQFEAPHHYFFTTILDGKARGYKSILQFSLINHTKINRLYR